MEMENSRRSMDRSRESGVVKKPRLGEDGDGDRRVDGDRVFPRSLASRLRASERGREGGREEPTRGGDYQHQQQEIIGQYKGALSELTFNSKPIITNLTIIAGENLHAAKGIAATICANILEVPSEQKLPSLYLLDSIVKNIGSDYIKYFAARLPEVFSRAYRQVDSSVLPAMRHLFGTWKGVFPPSSLQIIEKELGFQPIINSSSSGASTTRSDSQTQRPTHSIHVNPKYLERHLQQSNRAKESGVDSGNAVASSDVERPNRASIIESTRPRTEFLAKMPNIHRPQREKLNGSSHEKNPNAKYEDFEFVSDLPQNGNVRIAERSGLDTPSYGVGSNAVDATSGQRNALEFPNSYKCYRAPRPAQTVTKLNPTQEMGSRNTRDTPGSWKNSEEEEYMWDMNSRLTDQGGTDSSSKDGLDCDSSKKLESVPRGKWMPLENEHLDTRWSMSNTFPRLDKPSRVEDRVPFQREVEYHLPQPRDVEDIRSRFSRETSADSLSRVGGQATFGHRTPSAWPNQERLSTDGLNHKNVGSVIVGQSDGLSNILSGGLSTSSSLSLTRTGLQLHTGDPSVGVGPSNFGPMVNVVSVSSGMSHQRQQPLTAASSSASSPGHQHPQSPLSAPHQYKQPQTSTNHIQLQLQSSQPGQRPSQLSEQLNQAPNLQTTQDSSAVLPQNHIQSGLFRNLSVSSQPPQHLERSSPSLSSFTPLRHTLPFSQQPKSELPLQQTRSQSSFLIQKSSQASSFVAPQTTTAYSGLGHTEIPVADILGHSSTGNLLAAIMKSGLVTTNNPVAGNFPNPSIPDSLTQSNLNAQPPLPSGPPPPTQLTSSTMPMVPPTSVLSPTSLGKESIHTNALKAILPPLPPGPPPQSSLVGTSSQGPSTANTIPNPLSSLLSSLVAKGLIATPQKEATTFNAPQVPIDSSLPVSTSSFLSSIPKSSSDKELIANDISLSQTPVLGSKSLLGIEFKPEVIRQEHPLVIRSLFDDLPHQCSICGLRFKLQEQLSGHMEWHGSKKLEQGGCDTVSRKWFIGLSSWVAGHLEPSTGPVHATYMEEEVMTAETSEPLVPADENQIICALCGEPFEDFYSEDADEWMYRGAVYMTIPVEGNMRTTGENTMEGPIVHANCVSTVKKEG